MPLTDLAARNAQPREKDYKLADAAGMYLLVKKDGSKYWRLKYRFAGKEKALALGVYPAISLAVARKKTAEAKAALADGQDPQEIRERSKREVRLAATNAFEVIAREWWVQQKDRWSEEHAQRVLQTLIDDVFPRLGNRPITQILPTEVLETIRLVEKRGALDVAGRLLQRCSSVFRYAVQTGRATTNAAAELTGALKVRKVQHQPSLPPAELPEFFRRLRCSAAYPQNILAMRLLLLTFVRPGELRGARWTEFDIEQCEWRIPAERMKMNSEHIVPLSKQAIELLTELKSISGRFELLFPSERSRTKPISENTLTFALYRMGYKDRATPHGFRATASSILNEQGFNRDAIERQLAHMERNKIRGTYTHHAEFLKDRRLLMQWWADHLEALEKGDYTNGSDQSAIVSERLREMAPG